MAIESFAIGTLIIPMDTTYQNLATGAKPNGMITAYGLVYHLLENSIPVKWAILPNKATINTADFTASAQDIQTLATITNHGYAGGPFIIDSAYAATALPLITSWQSTSSVTVHRATSPFSAPIAITLNRAPRISIEENNASIMYGYLNDAGIPDSLGNVWTNASPDILDHTEIANYGFFTSATDPCKKLKYDIFLSPHTSDGDWSGSNPTEVAARDALDTFLRVGGMMHATCHSIGSIENIVGPFITTAGFPSFPNKGTTGTFTVDEPDFPSAQGVSTPSPQSLPGGSEQTWLHTSVTYRPSARELAHFIESSLQYDFMAAGSYKGGTGAGKIVYEGGHEYKYKMEDPYTDSDNTDMLYLRYVLDSVLFSAGKPRINLITLPQNIPAGSPTTVAFVLVNEGGSDAAGATASITLAPFVTYNLDATITPTSIVGQTLTWDATALAGNTGPGIVLTFTAQVTPPITGTQSVATYNFAYGDEFNESYSLEYCTSLNATPGAAPFVLKTPLNQTVNPNGSITWTITGGNNGTLALQNVVVTDTLPTGLTYVSAVPVPSSIVGNIITWNLPDIPPLTPVGFTITLTALAPPATTATYTNQVNLSGTDTSPASYSEDATAQVQVVNRPPTVTVTYPNGGEVICSGATITWTASDPDGDPLTYTVEYSSNGGSTWTTLASGISTTSYVWNTAALPSGSNYLVKVIATDGELSAEDVSDGPFTIDNTPPMVYWVSPNDGDLLSTTPVTLQAFASDNVAVSNVEFFYSTDGIIFTSIGIDSTPGPGNIYSVNWELTGLAQGTYILRAEATDDPCGKTAIDDIEVLVNLPPEVNITNPLPGDLVCPPGTTITWVGVSPDMAPLTYDVYYSKGGISYTLLASDLTASSFVWNIAALASGTDYYVKVIASDGIATAEDISGPFTIDNTPPTVLLTAPANGSILSAPTTVVSAIATDNVGVTQVVFEYSPDGITYFLIGTETVPVGTTYSTVWNTGILPSGEYKLRATAYDSCGNNAAAQIDVIVDRPPQVTITNPEAGDIVCPPGTTITWVATDPDLDPLTYTVYYSPSGPGGWILLASGLTTPSFNWDTTALSSSNSYYVRVVASDGYLTAEDISGPFTIDNTPPVVQFISPASGSYISGTVTVSATATDNVGVIGVTFEYSSDGINYYLIGTVTTPVGTTYALPWNTLTVADGAYTLRATAADGCNNQSQVTRNVIVDNTPPTVEIVSPPDGSTVYDLVNLIFNAADNECLSKVDVYIDGVLVYTDQVGGGLSTDFIYEWDTTAYDEGPHVVTAVATDCAGLTAQTQHTYIVDNLPDCFTQILVDGYLTIPPQKPDAEYIISFDLTWTVNDVKTFNTINGTKIIVAGFLDIGVTYSATDTEQTEHYASFSLPFAGMMLCPEISLNDCLCPVILVEHEQHHLINPRTIKKDIVLFIGVRVC